MDGGNGGGLKRGGGEGAEGVIGISITVGVVLCQFCFDSVLMFSLFL